MRRRIETRGLSDLRAVVLATDGLSEPGIGVAEPDSAVYGAVAQVEFEAPSDRRAVETCRGVVEVAMRAHRDQRAGDNAEYCPLEFAVRGVNSVVAAGS